MNTCVLQRLVEDGSAVGLAGITEDLDSSSSEEESQVGLGLPTVCCVLRVACLCARCGESPLAQQQLKQSSKRYLAPHSPSARNASICTE
jgi:hypothetical protein